MASAEQNKVRLTVVTPYKNFIDEDVTSIMLPTLDGEVGVMAGHTPLVLALRPGIVTVRTDDKVRHFTVSEGYTEVGRDLVLVICNAAEWPEDIHVRWISEAREEAYKLREEVMAIEDKESRTYAMSEVDEKLLRVKARTHLISLYGNDHQKERLEEFELN